MQETVASVAWRDLFGVTALQPSHKALCGHSAGIRHHRTRHRSRTCSRSTTGEPNDEPAPRTINNRSLLTKHTRLLARADREATDSATVGPPGERCG